MTAVARLEGVRKRFGDVVALDAVHVELREGEVLALLGPNGAGKTTAIDLLVGLRRPDAGRCVLHGRDPRDPRARARVGVTPQQSAFPGTLRVRELLDLVGRHYERAPPVADLVARFGLGDVAGRQAGGLSGGRRRLVALALAFAGAPATVVLDEPTVGLDLAARRAVWDEIRGFATGGGTTLLTTHHVEEVEALATRVVVLARGRVVADAPPAELRAATGLRRLRFRSASVPALPGVVRAETEGDLVTVHTADVRATLTALVHADVALDTLEVTTSSLEEALLSLTAEEG